MTGKIGFVFDMDGTLINSTEMGDAIGREIYKEFNIQPTEEMEKEIEELVFKIMQGENRKNLEAKIMWEIFKVVGLNFTQRIKALKIAARVFKEEKEKIKLFDGVEKLFDLLDDNGFSYAVATTSSMKEVDERLSKFPDFYKKLSGKIISRSSVENMKPHPESMKLAASMMNVPLNRCIIVGDMHTDINMGKTVGAVTIGVLTGIFTKEKLLELNPDFILDSVADIPQVIEEIKQVIEKN